MSQECFNLPDEKFANLLLENNQKPPFKIGTTLKYDCNLGYVPTDTTIPRKYPVFTCKLKNNKAVWDFDVKACKPVHCGFPGDLPNAKRKGYIFDFPKFVEYECNEGFKMLGGQNKLYCTAGGYWFPSVTKLKCQQITCPNLKVPANGSITYTNQNNYNSEATYSCDEGFRLIGNEKRRCFEIWSGIEPKCEKITCPPPFLNAPQNIYDYKDIVTYPQTNQQVLAKCGKDGQWIRKFAFTGNPSNLNAPPKNTPLNVQNPNFNKMNPIQSMTSKQYVPKYKAIFVTIILFVLIVVMFLFII